MLISIKMTFKETPLESLISQDLSLDDLVLDIVSNHPEGMGSTNIGKELEERGRGVTYNILSKHLKSMSDAEYLLKKVKRVKSGQPWIYLYTIDYTLPGENGINKEGKFAMRSEA